LVSNVEAGTWTYTCFAIALRFVDFIFKPSSLSNWTARFLELGAIKDRAFGESSMSISLAGVVGIDGLLKRELPAVEGDSDCEGERNLALLGGGMDAVKTTAR
jgi:hypothetical protein